jgi:flagellar hook-length control protein FliK
MMQLPLLTARPTTAALPAAAGAQGSPAAAGREGSGFGAVLGEILGDKAVGAAGETPTGQGSTEALVDAAAAGAEGAPENTGTPDGAAAAQADVTVAVPDAAAAFGQLLLSAPAVVPVAVPVPADTAAVGSATAGLADADLSDSDLPGAEPSGTWLTNGVAPTGVTTRVQVQGAATPAVSLSFPGNPGVAPAAGPGPVAIPAVPAGPGPANPAEGTSLAVGPSTAINAGVSSTASQVQAPVTSPTAAESATTAAPAPTTGQGTAPTAAAFAAVLPAPVQVLPAIQQDAPAPMTAPAAAAPFTDPGRLTPQLAGPLFSLASAAPGQHVMTLQVSPEDLGPMTVRAHIDATGVRIELFAPGDAGRDALRTILPELRRGLAESGLGASLDLSDHGAPPDSGAGEPGQDRRAQYGSQPPLTFAATAEPARPSRFRAAVVLPGTTPAVLDILV